MKPKHTLWTARFFAALGTGIVCTELFRYWKFDHRIEGWVIAIGSSFGFIGYYLLDRTGALGAFGFLRDSTIQVVSVVRSGRRITDPVVAQTTTTAPAATPAAPVPPVLPTDTQPSIPPAAPLPNAANPGEVP